jgi:MauM/NapG family ferredoxin protein
MPDPDGAEPIPVRRRFFARGARILLDGLDEVARALRRAALTTGGPAVASGPVLRPPGALPEAEFASTCERSGRCVEVCPVRAITPLRSADPARDGTPMLVPSLRACVVCDDLSCMKACPSGALRLVPRESIRIGLAAVDHERCVRSTGEPCRECVDRCPLGPAAIAIDARGRIAVRDPGCVGCGVCELYCPSRPRAITIRSLAS